MSSHRNGFLTTAAFTFIALVVTVVFFLCAGFSSVHVVVKEPVSVVPAVAARPPPSFEQGSTSTSPQQPYNSPKFFFNSDPQKMFEAFKKSHMDDCTNRKCHEVEHNTRIFVCECNTIVALPITTKEKAAFVNWEMSRSINHEEEKVMQTCISLDTVQPNSFHLEIGALDGLSYSNTLMFTKKSYSIGVLYEAQARQFFKLLYNRPMDIKVFGTLGSSVLQPGGGYNSINEGGAAFVTGTSQVNHLAAFEAPLTTVLDLAHQQNVFSSNRPFFNFASIDVEGLETAVIPSVVAMKPKCIVVEVRFDEKGDVLQMLQKTHQCQKDGENAFCSSL